jgi:peptidoglycan/xylan/chitin deacetylase (PgdA/CDA1 family)
MAIEIKSNRNDIRWPVGVRLPVMLTFEHQSGEGAPLFPGDRPNYMVGGAMQYGARRGIWNILELLDKYSVKATFFVLGTTAEKYPETVKAIAKAGHEIAGMGYGFESIRTASEERERSIVRRSSQVLQEIAGSKIQGWRCPDYRVSPQTIEILADEGMVWDSTYLNDDLPYLFQCHSRMIVEIPFTTSTADKTYIGYPYPQRGGPDGLASVWNDEFEVLYRESERSPRLLTVSLQTWATGRPAPLRVLSQFLQRLVGHEEFRFARCSDVAAWRLNPRLINQSKEVLYVE